MAQDRNAKLVWPFEIACTIEAICFTWFAN